MSYRQWGRDHPVRAWICIAILILLAAMAFSLTTGIGTSPGAILSKRAAAKDSCGNWSQDVRDVKAGHMKCSNALRQVDRFFNAFGRGDCATFFDPCVVHGFRCRGERRSAFRAKGKCKRLSRKGAVVWDQVLSH